MLNFNVNEYIRPVLQTNDIKSLRREPLGIFQSRFSAPPTPQQLRDSASLSLWWLSYLPLLSSRRHRNNLHVSRLFLPWRNTVITLGSQIAPQSFQQESDSRRGSWWGPETGWSRPGERGSSHLCRACWLLLRQVPSFLPNSMWWQWEETWLPRSVWKLKEKAVCLEDKNSQSLQGTLEIGEATSFANSVSQRVVTM